jgi:predicted lipase
MIEPLVLAQICADVYADTPVGFDHVWDFSGNHAAHKKIDDVDVIVFRGSKDTQDWLRDVEAVPLWDYRIGFVHGGFMCGVNDILVAASLVVGSKVVVTGHSLGGARARIYAALMAYSKQPVSQCCVFGSPRPGFANMSRILQKSGTPLASYRNRNDPVPLVPFMGGLYTHPDQWIALDSAPPPGDLEPLRDHHIVRYLDGLKK